MVAANDSVKIVLAAMAGILVDSTSTMQGMTGYDLSNISRLLQRQSSSVTLEHHPTLIECPALADIGDE